MKNNTNTAIKPAAETTAAPTLEKVGFINLLMRGSLKGLKLWFNNILPSCVLAALIVTIVQVTGLIDLISDVMGPFMSIFGLPGEAIVPWATGWLNMATGMVSAVPLLKAGVLNGDHATILLAMIMASTAIDKMIRLSNTAGADGKTSMICCGLTVLCSMLTGVVMNLLISFI